MPPSARLHHHPSVRLSTTMSTTPATRRATTRILTLTLLLLALCITPTHAIGFRVNIGGPEIMPIGFFADLTPYLTNTKSLPVTTNAPLNFKSQWKAVYNSYRYAFSGNLEYKLPVPADTYNIALMFAETWPDTQKKGARVFNIKINGALVKKNVDVFKAVGANKPYYLQFKNIKAKKFLTITIERISGKENPMLSGLVLNGKNPSALLKFGTSTTKGSKGNTKTSDPKCETGIFGINTGSGKMACCEKACGKCGGNKCGKFAPGKSCCISQFKTMPSCDDALPPCVPSANPNPTPTCKKGGIYGKSQKGAVCCPAVCKKCGGKGCFLFAPGSLCCINMILALKKNCATNDPPCVSPLAKSPVTPKPPVVTTEAPPAPKAPDAPTCKKGLLGWNATTKKAACCPDVCGTCGGPGCGKRAPAGIKCCVSDIVKNTKSCDVSNPPCVPQTNTTPTTSTTPTTPTTKAPPVPPKTQPPPDTTDDGAGTGSCPLSGATKNSFSMNIASGVIAGANFGADNENYISSKSKGQIFSLPTLKISAPSGPKPWDMAYASHRFTTETVLSYAIPVPSGTYKVSLMFAENYFMQIGERVFDVFINGVEVWPNLDIFASVGKNKGLLKSFTDIKPVGGKITVAVFKVVENPMISAIMIEGKGAGLLAQGGGCVPIDDKGDGDLNDGFNHRAHSVPGGPYFATDFTKSNEAFVSLDGTQSHSHYNDPGPPPVTGKIVSFKWSWTKNINGNQIAFSNSDKSGKFTASFPIGKTPVTLEVVDNTGDVAVDKTDVIVKGSAEKGVYCYFYDFDSDSLASVPLGNTIDSDPKPLFAAPFDSINFNNAGKFSKVPFADKSFAVRCVFFISVAKAGSYSFTVEHNGPFKMLYKGSLLATKGTQGKTVTPAKTLDAGLNSFQLMYFRPQNTMPILKLSKGGNLVPPGQLEYDLAGTLPIITGLSKDNSAPSGGQKIQIFGSGFINGVAVKFGKVEAQNLISSDAGTVQVTVPPGKTGVVSITVSTNAGTSNEFQFTYTSSETLNQPVVFQKKTLKNQDGSAMEIPFIASVKYGPDGRLYLGSIKGQISALSVDKSLKVTSKCQRSIGATRAVLGLAFNPAVDSLKMYFTSSTLYWKDYNLFSFEEGWPNGKVESIVWSKTALADGSGKSCAGAVQDQITGLPVSNHDHGINKLQFLPNGQLLISVGSFTNGGVSVPGKKPVPGDPEDDALGGVASNPLSASIVSCPTNKVINIKYNQYVDPETAKITSGKECTIHASGVRNSFGMALHTNGNLYAMDNGPNAGFGDFITGGCSGGTVPAENVADRMFLIQKGKYHGHPNLNRKECGHYPASAVQPLLKNVQSSSAGILEYRSNTFGGEIKSNLYLSQFAGQNDGQMGQVKLSEDGKSVKSFQPVFLEFSGVAGAEGPRGEIALGRVYKTHVEFAEPKYSKPSVTFLLGVHPKEGPAKGGQKVLLSGFKFGTKPEATFGGKKCTNVQVIDDEQFTCMTPQGSKNKQVAVIVTGSAGVSPSYSGDFWYW